MNRRRRYIAKRRRKAERIIGRNVLRDQFDRGYTLRGSDLKKKVVYFSHQEMLFDRFQVRGR